MDCRLKSAGYNEGRYGCFEKTSKNQKGTNKESAKESAEIGKSSGFPGLRREML